MRSFVKCRDNTRAHRDACDSLSLKESATAMACEVPLLIRVRAVDEHMTYAG